MFVRKMHEEQTKRGKKHNGGSDDQSCLKKSIENQRNAQKLQHFPLIWIDSD